MRLPKSAHFEHPWFIHRLAPDFRLEDVWALPTPGRHGDFPRLVEAAASMDLSKSSSLVARALFEIRWKIGTFLGWDSKESGVGARVQTLRDRLPEELRDSAGPDFDTLPFKPVYMLEDEWAAEIANKTMHGVLHLGWVKDGDGYRGQLAVLVKTNGLFGDAYMAAIKPFRYALVYPALMRDIEKTWRAQAERGVAL